MRKIQIVVFGKTEKKFFQESEDFYLKRLSPFTQVEYVLLKDEKIGKGVDEKKIKAKEAKKFFEVFPKKNYLVACDVKGKKLSSEDLAETLEKISFTHSGITFVIGSALGLPSEILDACDAKISFSAMTFPHDFFRSMLLEQLYRSFMILGNREYHK